LFFIGVVGTRTKGVLMLRIGTLSFVGALTAWLFFACGDKGYQPQPVETIVLDSGASSLDGGCNTPHAISFSLDIMPLLKRECSCHVDGTNGPALNTYQNVLSAAHGSNLAIQNGSMPPSRPLSDADKALFQSWINAGKPNN
jgi:hypothetical protein